jgi:small subunit ribosomal protein S14
MAKNSVIEREKKRASIYRRYRDKRNQLRDAVRDTNIDDDVRMDAVRELQELPRNSSRSRARNRCKLCGRPRAYNRLTGLCRLHMRLAVINGMVPGMHKASW